MEERICRKCLLKDMTDSEYYKSVYEYIENLPEDMKTDGEVYEKRLAWCKSCRHLMNGMCRLCGCFVEIRASKRGNHCAESEKVW